MGNESKNENVEKNPFWRRLKVLIPVIVAIIGCIGSVAAALAGQEPFATLLFGKASPTATVAITNTQTPASVTPISPPPEIATVEPTIETRAQLHPGEDWFQDCICEQWIVYPPSAPSVKDDCYAEPLPGSIFTSNNRLILRAEPDVFSAEEYGIFTKVPQSGTIRTHIDLDFLENAEIWIGIFSEPDLESEGILMVVPHYEPTKSPGSDTRKRAFALRHVQIPLENRIYLSTEFEDSDGIYEIGFNLTSGTIAGFMENEITEDFPVSYTDRWLFIGYRALIRRSNIDVSFTNLEIIER